MVDTTSKVMTPLTLTILSNSVNHTLNKGELMDTISYATMRDQSRNVTVRNVTYNQTTRSVFVNITVDAPSIVYLVMQAKTTPDPNNEQVMNCFDGDNNTALNCFRLVANRASTINVELPQMVQGDYRVAYISTNEFIFRPKTTSTFPTTVNSTTVFGGKLALVTIAVIITLLASM